MFIHFDMIHERDRHTGTPDDGIGRAYASHRAAKMCRVQVSSVDKQVVEQLDIVRDRRT